MRPTFSVRRTDRLTLFKPASFEGFYALSPFVWKGASRYEMLLRLVNPSSDASRKVARIHHAESGDGLSFEMAERASIPTGPSREDRDGCEDPTVAIVDDFGTYITPAGIKASEGATCFMPVELMQRTSPRTVWRFLLKLPLKTRRKRPSPVATTAFGTYSSNMPMKAHHRLVLLNPSLLAGRG